MGKNITLKDFENVVVLRITELVSLLEEYKKHNAKNCFIEKIYEVEQWIKFNKDFLNLIHKLMQKRRK